MAALKKTAKKARVSKKASKIAKKTSKAATKKKKVLSEQEVQKRRQTYAVRSLFSRLSFARIKTNGIEFTFQGRTSEFDDCFVYRNIVILAEYTVVSDTASHVAKKSLLYNKISEDEPGWVDFSASVYSDFKEIFDAQDFDAEDYRVFICYFSNRGVSEEYESSLENVKFLDGTRLRYFQALIKAIHQSARHEFFSYLGLEHSEIGANIKNSNDASKSFEGHLLPPAFSSFPKGFKVVSFYADPGTLLQMSYVLRRDSWRDPEGMYQRVLQKGRMNQMRKYLTTEQRVFVNNLIVTLPSETALNDPSKKGKNLLEGELKSVRSVQVVVPEEYNSIGVVDGQHRIYCYHEGTDKYEDKIKPLRDRQNLLVTGIIYPDGYADRDRRRFEAKLFLEINDKQKRTSSDLKHSIEMILSPYSTISIAKSVINRLNASGPLKGMLQTNYFDPPTLIRTTSIVSYGLRPLLKLDGEDSLFSKWTNSSKSRLKVLQKERQEVDSIEHILELYIAYASRAINEILIGAKLSDDQSRWRLTEKAADRHLSPTVINGFIYCLRMIIQNGVQSGGQDFYRERFEGLDKFSFKKYKSSNWGMLGKDLYQKFFSKLEDE